jgi:hypothetical protein
VLSRRGERQFELLQGAAGNFKSRFQQGNRNRTAS